MQEKKKRRNAKPKYSPAIVRAVLYNVQNSSQTLAQIAAKYGLPQGSGSPISKWVKKYSSDFSVMEELQPSTGDASGVSQSAKTTVSRKSDQIAFVWDKTIRLTSTRQSQTVLE